MPDQWDETAIKACIAALLKKGPVLCLPTCAPLEAALPDELVPPNRKCSITAVLAVVFEHIFKLFENSSETSNTPNPLYVRAAREYLGWTTRSYEEVCKAAQIVLSKPSRARAKPLPADAHDKEKKRHKQELLSSVLVRRHLAGFELREGGYSARTVNDRYREPIIDHFYLAFQNFVDDPQRVRSVASELGLLPLAASEAPSVDGASGSRGHLLTEEADLADSADAEHPGGYIHRPSIEQRDLHVPPPFRAGSDRDQHPQERSRNKWVELASTHKVWKFTKDYDQFLPVVEGIASGLYDRWQKSEARLQDDPQDDPWRDSGLAERMMNQLDQLISDLQQPPTQQMDFFPAEAGLLVLTPLAYQVWSMESAVELLGVKPTELQPQPDSDKKRREYERFLSRPEHSRLVSRTKLVNLPNRGGEQARKAIGWWLFHQWVRIRSRPSDRAHQLMDAVDKPGLEQLTDTVRKLTSLFRLTPDELRGELEREGGRGLSSKEPYSGINGGEADENLVGILLVVAHARAIELMSLPMTLVEHLGIPRAVDLDQLRTTIDKSDWMPTGNKRLRSTDARSIALVVDCGHEAVWEALRGHVGHTTAVFAAVRAVVEHRNLEPLLCLPLTASVDYIRPSKDKDGKRLFEVPAVRFRLDEIRVRELLMGENLYGDKSLAIRELYQNALDACRWRQARHRDGWEGYPKFNWTDGQIKFFQGEENGEENGRYILRCTDDGVGMSESDLREVFSRVGVRFADRREFHEEEEKGVKFFPNSRFGIGTLSYFMLADEIEVRTRRPPQNGKLEPGLRVLIAGPGHLFHIESFGADEEVPIGTMVTLYLRDARTAPSCVEVLQRLLGIAEFRTSATHDRVEWLWEPHQFTVRSQRGKSAGGIDGINVRGAVVGCEAHNDGQVVWCEDGGGLLVDGIHVGLPDEDDRTLGQLTKINGAVVNLTGQAVSLTVDRTRVREDVMHRVVKLMIEAVPRLLETPPSFLTFRWLCQVAKTTPAVADAITEAVGKAELELPAEDGVVDMSTIGCFPLDGEWVDRLPKSGGGSAAAAARLDDHLVLWRLLAHNGVHALTGLAGCSPPNGIADVRPARPTDQLLVDWSDSLDTEQGQPDSERIPPGHVVNMAFLMNANPAAVLNRLANLGYDFRARGSYPEPHSTDLILLSRDLDGVSPWLDSNKPVPLGHLIAAHRQTGIPVKEIVPRLKNYSFDTKFVAPFLVGDLPFTYHDEFLVSTHVDGKDPWLTHENQDPVGLAHVVHAAIKLQMNVSTVVNRLDKLRFNVTPPQQSLDWIGEIRPDEAGIVLDKPLLRPDGKVAPAWIACVALWWRITPREAAGRLNDLALEPPLDNELPNQLDESDKALLGKLTDLVKKVSLSVPLHLLWRCAKQAKCALTDAAARLTALGFSVPPDEAIAREFDDLDEWLLDHLAERNGYSTQPPQETLIAIASAAWRNGKLRACS